MLTRRLIHVCCCRFARDNCPSYLVEKNFNELKAGRLEGLNIFSGTFMDALKQRQYSKVRQSCLPHHERISSSLNWSVALG